MESFIAQSLAKGEKIVYRTTPHWMVYRAGVIALLVSLPFVVWALHFGLNDTDVGADVLLVMTAIPGGALLLGAFFLLFQGWVQHRFCEYVVTNKRLAWKTGFFSRTMLELQLSKIESFIVVQSLLGQAFNHGTVVVTGTGGMDEGFGYVPDPFVFKKWVTEQAG